MSLGIGRVRSARSERLLVQISGYTDGHEGAGFHRRPGAEADRPCGPRAGHDEERVRRRGVRAGAGGGEGVWRHEASKGSHSAARCPLRRAPPRGRGGGDPGRAGRPKLAGTSMRECVLDASVVLEWFSAPEASGDGAGQLRVGFESGDLAIVAPSLIHLEILNVAGRRWGWNGEAL